MTDPPDTPDFAHNLAYLSAAVAASLYLWIAVLTAAGCIPLL